MAFTTKSPRPRALSKRQERLKNQNKKLFLDENDLLLIIAVSRNRNYVKALPIRLYFSNLHPTNLGESFSKKSVETFAFFYTKPIFG